MKHISYKNLSATILWWIVTLMEGLCFTALVTVLPVRLRNGWVLHAATSVLLNLAGVKVKVDGLKNICRDQTYIFVANHQSWFDSFVLCAVLPVPVTFISKKEMFRVPIYSHIMRRLRFVCADRRHPRNILRDIDSIVALFRSGLSLVVYPEGTRSKDGKLGSFGRGAVLLAARTGVSIIPITIVGTREIMPSGKYYISYGRRVRIFISDVVDVDAADRKKQATITEEIRQQIVESLRHNPV